jgi:hypothetical protein
LQNVSLYYAKEGLEIGDIQLRQVVDGYYNNENFSRSEDGSISVWNL